VLVDANLLLYATDRRSPFHDASASWIEAQLNSGRRVGIPWPALLAFVRIITNPRATQQPLTARQARAQVDAWLERDVVWTPAPTDGHGAILGDLIERYDLRGNLVSDAHLAALAMEHGLTVYSADSDFARFPEVTWRNPLVA
jgi:toxin-antitoxin system PIN domain toxin